MRTCHLIVVLSGLCVAGMALAADPPRNYESTVSRKSIFSRDRHSRVPTSRPVTTFVAPAPASPVLTGIIREDGGTYMAVLETPGTAPAYVRLGESLPGKRGVITEMNLDCFVFVPAPGEAPRKAFIGRNLDGAEATLSGPSSSASASDAPIEGDDVISRMRRRRQQEGR